MKRRKIHLLATPLASMLAFCVLLVMACEEKEPVSQYRSSVAESLKLSEIPDQESENAHIYLYNGNLRSVDIETTRMWKFSQKDSVIAWELKVNFYDTTGEVTSHLVSDSGYIKEVRDQMVALGNVVLIGKDSSVLETQALTYDNKTQMISSDVFVSIVKGTDTLRGIGFRSDRELRRVRILKQVSGSFSEDILDEASESGDGGL